MARKNYIKGMEDGAKPFEEKFQKQADAIERLGNRIDNRLDDIETVNKIILEDLSVREKKELYDLNTVVDIAELDDTEKEFLMSVLYTLAGMTEEVTELQQSYIRSVKKYLGIHNVQTEVDLSCIVNIDSKKQTKAILQTVMEFLFLENCNHDYQDEYEDVLDYFDAKPSDVLKIQKNIDAIYNAVGAEGLAEKYGLCTDENNIEGNSNYNMPTDNLRTILSEKGMLFFDIDIQFTLHSVSDMGEMYYFGDQIHSEYDAKKRATGLIASAHSSAESFFLRYGSNSICRFAADKLLTLIKNDILKLYDAIDQIDEKERKAHQHTFDEICELLDIDELQERIESITESELDNRFCRLPSASSYDYKIEYYATDTDGGWGALFKTKNWTFNASNAWVALSDDVDRCITTYINNVSSRFRQEIIAPIINLIDSL